MGRLTFVIPFGQSRFRIWTNHEDLKWHLEMSDIFGRLNRQRIRVAKFKFQVVHRAGITYEAADTLSRLQTRDADEALFGRRSPHIGAQPNTSVQEKDLILTGSNRKSKLQKSKTASQPTFLKCSIWQTKFRILNQTYKTFLNYLQALTLESECQRSAVTMGKNLLSILLQCTHRVNLHLGSRWCLETVSTSRFATTDFSPLSLFTTWWPHWRAVHVIIDITGSSLALYGK